MKQRRIELLYVHAGPRVNFIGAVIASPLTRNIGRLLVRLGAPVFFEGHLSKRMAEHPYRIAVYVEE